MPFARIPTTARPAQARASRGRLRIKHYYRFCPRKINSIMEWFAPFQRVRDQNKPRLTPAAVKKRFGLKWSRSDLVTVAVWLQPTEGIDQAGIASRSDDRQ